MENIAARRDLFEFIEILQLLHLLSRGIVMDARNKVEFALTSVLECIMSTISGHDRQTRYTTFQKDLVQ